MIRAYLVVFLDRLANHRILHLSICRQRQLGIRDRSILGLDLPVADWAREEGIDETQVRERLEKAADEASEQGAQVGAPLPWKRAR